MTIEKSYTTLWETMVLNLTPAQQSLLDFLVKRITENKSQYAKVSKEAYDIPPLIIAAIHAMESGCDFSAHLHNGDPLTNVTKNYPAGRPVIKLADGTLKTHNFTWVESAVDALKSEIWRINPTDWCLENSLLFLEAYNGFGYKRRGILSPYLWAGTRHYTKGKYTKDGFFDPNAVSKQVGACVILNRLGYRASEQKAPRHFYLEMRGEEVVALQTLLNKMLPPNNQLVVDGWLGSKTSAAMTAVFGRSAF